MNILRTLYQVFVKYRLHIAVLCIFGIVGALLEGVGINIAIPLLSFFTGGGGVPTDPISRFIAAVFGFVHIPFTFRYLLIFVVALFFGRAIAMGFFNYIRGWIVGDFLSSESGELFSRLLAASWPFLLKQKIGHIQTALTRDIQRASMLLDMMTQFIQSATGFTMYFVVAFALSPRMMLLTLVAAVVLLYGVRPFLRRTVLAGEDMSVTEKHIAQFLSEHVIGMKLVKASGVAAPALARVQGLLAELREAYARIALQRSISTSLFQPFSLIFVVLLFFIMYKTPEFSIITFAATLYLIQKIFVYAQSAQSSLHGVSELLPYVRDMARFKNELEVAAEKNTTGKASFVFKRSMQLQGVSLMYGEHAALGGLSVTISRGESVGIIGPSGAGKTSFADLLLRLFEAQQGSILLDGVSATEIGVNEWRRHVSYVPQEVFLFNASIADNVRFYRPEISDQEVVEALRQANIYDTVASLPEGIETHVGDRGVMLSGGQRQRVALARALAGRPELLVLDEATSALDAESERLIQESIRTLHGKITIVIIAHRLSTIENVDTLLVLDGGKLVEQGSPKTLRENPASYLSRMQEL